MREEELQEAEDMDPSVPTELLDLFVELDMAGVTPEEFRVAAEEGAL